MSEAAAAGKNWCLEDPDLMPTFDDWLLVQRVNTSNGTRRPLCFSYDGAQFLDSFFHQPAAWRLIHCATCAYESGLPEDIQLSYFRRARKAVLQAMCEKPTYQTVQTFYFITLFAAWKGQPEAGRPFLKAALDLVISLRLDIDPDDSPWLFNLNLSPREKEDRRRAFWSTFWHLKFEQAVSSDAIHVSIDSSRIKPPGAVHEPYTIFEALPQTKWVCDVYSLISAIKSHYSSAPKSIDFVLASDAVNSLHARFLHLQSAIPIQTFLIPESPQSITSTDRARFQAQLHTQSPGEQLDMLYFNVEFLSSQCVLYRPRLYLSGLNSCNPMYLHESSQYIIANAIQQCLDNAFRIANLLDYILEADSYTHTGVYPFFEAMTVFWFIWCRMNRVWWTLLSSKRIEWPLMQSIIVKVVGFVRKVNDHEGTKTGTTAPILKCLEAMLNEMEDIERGAGKGNVVDSPESDEVVEEVVLGMKIVSLDDASGAHDNRGQYRTKEPHCYLGLLGMDVGGRVRWKGPTEQSWKLFWKLYA
ncbi:hypothetical protein BDR26DRAFT_880215 [Obelidium mucronatum]|nr:hypothetical protein BDR26DRAFT_880215 [Obelidium mucronatum]